METLDYLRVARRRLKIIILIPLLAVLAAIAYTLVKPTTYSATAVVSSSTLIGAPWSQYTGPQGAAQFASAFSQTVIGPPALDAASAQVHVLPHNIKNGVTVTQAGSSSNMSVTFTSTKRSNVAPTLDALTAASLGQMFAPQVAVAQSQVDADTLSLTNANTALTKLLNKYNVADPSAAYNAALSQLNGLRQQQSTLRADGKVVQANALNSAVAEARSAVVQFGPILEAYRPLAAAQQAATTDLNAARQNLRDASAQLAATNPKSIVLLSSVSRDSRLSGLVKTVIPVFGASLFLTFLVVAIVEMTADGRFRRAEVEAEEDGEPAWDGDERDDQGAPEEQEVYAGAAEADLEDEGLEGEEPAPEEQEVYAGAAEAELEDDGFEDEVLDQDGLNEDGDDTETDEESDSALEADLGDDTDGIGFRPLQAAKRGN